MRWFTNMKINTLRDLFLHQLKDLYDSELRLTDALPKMTDSACSPDVKAAFERHQRETEKHVERLERIFQQLREEPELQSCYAMKGLISEGEEIIDAEGDDMVKDAALIAAAQRIQHYEMAGYGTARAFARRLGYPGIAEMLQECLCEETLADKNLTSIAEKSVNPASAIAGHVPVINRRPAEGMISPI